ncbi:MAG: STAS domain-containing protein [Candidatus Omnitrophota bacterium]
MKVGKRVESDVTILQPQGRIDAASLQEFAASINRAAQDGVKKLLIDFSQTDYMSSAGVRVLIEGKKAMEAVEGDMAFCSVNDQLKELFEVVRLDRFFEIFATEFEALDKFLD